MYMRYNQPYNQHKNKTNNTGSVHTNYNKINIKHSDSVYAETNQYAQQSRKMRLELLNGCVYNDNINIFSLNYNNNLRTSSNNDPLYVAVRECKLDFVRLMKNRGADFNANLHTAVCPTRALVTSNRPDDQKLKMFQLLMEYGMDLNSLDASTGNNILHWFALDANNWDICIELIKLGVNPLQINSTGQTPMDMYQGIEDAKVWQDIYTHRHANIKSAAKRYASKNNKLVYSAQFYKK